MAGSMESILQAFVAMWPGVGYILMGLGALVVLGRVYVGVTPSQEDDAWFERLENTPILGALLKALSAFSPVPRQGERLEARPLKKKK